MDALYGESGRVVAWIKKKTLRIYDLKGKCLAVIEDDAVYDFDGSVIGWWHEGHIRDRSGALAYFSAEAAGLEVSRPTLDNRPLQPILQLGPDRPALQARPARPENIPSWSQSLPFG